MPENFFQNALHNFTFDVASGGAIAHLADLGYTPREIQGMLDYPTPYERVREAFRDYLLKEKIIVEEKSDLGKRQEKVSFVEEYDSYGRKSFRRVVEYAGAETAGDVDSFRALTYTENLFGPFPAFLKEYCCEGMDEENAKNAYVSCDFGLRMKRAQKEYEAFLKPLAEGQRSYIEDILWERKMEWHLLNRRMREILTVLYAQSDYHGTILLLDKKEKVEF